MKRRILFLCGRNDSLSFMAAAFLRHVDSLNFEALSTHMEGQCAHPLSVEVMKEIAVNMSERSVDDLQGMFDVVITMDEVSALQSPSVSAKETVHWKFENPLMVSDNPKLQRRAFQSVRDQIAQRVRLFAIVHARTERVMETPAARQATAVS